jgi:hypothetical protein
VDPGDQPPIRRSAHCTTRVGLLYQSHQSIRATPPLSCGPLWPGPLTAPRLRRPSPSSVMAGSLNDIARRFTDGRPAWTSRALKRGLNLNRPLSCPSSSPPVRLVPSTAAAGESRHRVSSGLDVEPGRVFCTRGCCSCPQLEGEATEPRQFLVVDRFPSRTTSHRDRVLLRHQGGMSPTHEFTLICALGQRC